VIKVGQEVQFDPSETFRGYGVEAIRGNVIGVVVAVNAEHHWFSVEYGKPKTRTSFHFSEIGQSVRFMRANKYGHGKTAE